MKKRIIALLLCAIAAITVSCNKENNRNSPLTSETIVGKKYFSDKVYGWEYISESDNYFERWAQAEILFADNNIAYLTCIKADYVTRNETRSEIKKASFNMAYPNIIIEATDDNGNVASYYASFTNNNTLVFEGDYRDIECSGVPMNWRGVAGVSFSTNPRTITGPFLGQIFVHQDLFWTRELRFGANYALWKSWMFELKIEYPDIRMTGLYDSTKSLIGHFVNADTIAVIQENGEIVDYVCTRIR